MEDEAIFVWRIQSHLIVGNVEEYYNIEETINLARKWEISSVWFCYIYASHVNLYSSPGGLHFQK